MEWSGRPGSNRRPAAPKAAALPLRYAPIALVGNSIGARVAGELAALQPERITALVLVSPLGAVSYSLAERLKWKAMSRRSIIQSVPEGSMRNASGYGFAVVGPGKTGFV